MIGRHTKAALDKAVDELKRDGYMVLVVMLDQKADENQPLGNGVEVLCSHTNDPRIVGAMLQETLKTLTGPTEESRVN